MEKENIVMRLGDELEKILTERERDLLAFRLDGDSHTLEECARRHSVTRERIRQIEAKALRKLERHPEILDKIDLEPFLK